MAHLYVVKDTSPRPHHELTSLADAALAARETANVFELLAKALEDPKQELERVIEIAEYHADNVAELFYALEVELKAGRAKR